MSSKVFSSSPTPPDSDQSTAPTQLSISEASAQNTSTSVARVVQLFTKHLEGTLPRALHTTHLTIDEYIELRETLKQHEELWCYVHAKIRFDYDSDAEELFVRMPTLIHELLATHIGLSIITQFNELVKSFPQPARKYLEGVRHCGTTDVRLCHQPPNGRWSFAKRSPDVSFRHLKEKYPSVIVEVSYSQQRKNLERLADNYIVVSEGDVAVVIGIDLEYRGIEARIMMWRPRIVKELDGSEAIVSEQTFCEVFRHANMEPASGNLTLEVRDFAYPDELEEVPDVLKTATISIPFKTMAIWLEEGELLEQSGEVEKRKKEIPGDRKQRLRESSSPEELGKDDEVYQQHLEEHTQRREEARDRDWIGHTGGATEASWVDRLRPRL